MKRIILILGILVSLAAVHVVFGQTNEGVITYEVKVNMHRRLPPDREGMKDMLPEFNVYKDQLFFRGDETYYKSVEEEEDDDFADEGGGMRMRFKRPSTETYFNYDANKRIALQEFMGKKYLIEDSVKIMPWKFGTETKTILGYTCRQATHYNEERQQTITAWYAEKLPPFIGPENFNFLPGTVLLVDINNGERVVTAQNIDMRPLKKGEMKIPSGGTKTTEKDFRKMVDEHMKRMGANGGVIIRN